MEESYTKALNLFGSRPVDAGILKIQYEDVTPNTPINSSDTIDFEIAESGNEYIDFAKSYLYVKAKIANLDNTPVTEADLVTFSNNSLYTFFEQVDVKLDDINICSGVSAYHPYKAIFDVLLNYDEDVKETKCQSFLYTKDAKLHMDSTNPDGGFNLGLADRYDITKFGHECELIGRLNIDLAQQPRFVLNNLKIAVSMSQHEDSFRLMTSAENASKYKVVVTKAVLKIRKITVSPLLILGHKKALSLAPALYPVMKSVIKPFSLFAGALDFEKDNLFNGKVPSWLCVAMVRTEAFRGKHDLNPFNFANFDLKNIKFQVGGTALPSEGFKLNFSTGQYCEAYHALSQYLPETASNYIDRLDFAGGYAMYVFDIDGHKSDNYVNRPKTGTTKLSMTFGSPLEHGVTVICYAKYPATITINAARNVEYFDGPY